MKLVKKTYTIDKSIFDMSQDMAMKITHLLYQKIGVLKNTRNKAQNKLDAAFWQQ